MAALAPLPASAPTSADALHTSLVSRTCYSFDDNFGGIIEEPHVSFASPAWTKVEFVPGGESGRLLQKPGYVASAAGARLVVSSVNRGVRSGTLRIGYLRTHRSRAMASARCLEPCSCAVTTLPVHLPVQASTTELSPPFNFSRPSTMAPEACLVELRLDTDGEAFKFVSLVLITRILGSGGR